MAQPVVTFLSGWSGRIKKAMYPPAANPVPIVANRDSRNIDQPIRNPNHFPTARRPNASGPPANGMATESSESASTHARYNTHTISDATNTPMGPPTGNPKFQPKYMPVITTPTPNAQM